MTKNNVRFNLFRWVLFILFSLLGGFIGIKIVNIKYVGSGLGTAIFATVAYFFFYFYDMLKIHDRKYLREKNSKLLKIYLIMSILFMLIGVIDTLTYYISGKYLDIIPLRLYKFIYLIFLVFSLYSLFIFIKRKFSKLTLIIPILTIIYFIFFSLLGSILAILYIKFNLNPIDYFKSPLYRMFDVTLGVIYVAVGSFLLYLFESTEKINPYGT